MRQTIARDEVADKAGLAIVEKYEAFVHYMLPILERCDRRHRTIRDTVMVALLAPIGNLYSAAHSKNVSKLYAIDAEFATLRAHLRLLNHIKAISPKQRQHAHALIAAPGAMLGAWIRDRKGRTGE